jgi:twitching motility protein PilT
VISQTLFRRSDGRGRVAALEVMVNTPAVANLVREGKTHQLVNVLQTGKKLGMQTLDDAINDLLEGRKISAEEAFDRCIDKKRFVERLPIVPEEYREMLEEARARSASNGSAGERRVGGERRVPTSPQVQR